MTQEAVYHSSGVVSRAKRTTQTREDHQSLSHTKWRIGYHIQLILRWIKMAISCVSGECLKTGFIDWPNKKDCIEEGHQMSDHVRRLSSRAPNGRYTTRSGISKKRHV